MKQSLIFPMNTIKIQPVQIWTKLGVKTATTFEIRYINYNGVNAVADCHIWTDDTPCEELQSTLVSATQQQCEAWGTDNVPFYNALAMNAGLSPTVDI